MSGGVHVGCDMSCYREIDEREGDISIGIYNSVLLRHLSETKRIDLYKRKRKDFANASKKPLYLVI